MKSPPLSLFTAATLIAGFVSLTGCKLLPDKKDGDEKESAAESDKDRSKRTSAEAAFYAECGKQGELGGTVTGRDGWLFSASELLQLSRISTTSIATGAIADYAQQLRSRNIDLIVVPVPPKALIYPDKVSRAAKVPMKSRRPARLDSPLKAAMDDLTARKIKVVDLTPAFIAHREDKDGTVFPRTGNTWSPYGVKIAVKEIADAVRKSNAGGRGSVTGISSEPVTLTFAGGLGTGASGPIKPETIQTVKVGRISGDKVRSLAFNTSGGSLLLMGDANILAWREANNPPGSSGAFCSLAEQLAAELHIIPDVLSHTDGRNSPRLRILRERTSGHGVLASTRTVVWVVSALDLTALNWQRVPLQLEFKLDSPGLDAPLKASQNRLAAIVPATQSRRSMLDIKSIRENPDRIKERLKLRGGDVWQSIGEVLDIDEKRRAAETEKQHLQSERNRTSREIGIAKKGGNDTTPIEAQMRAIGDRIGELNEQSNALDAAQEALLLSIPNLPHDACPEGADAAANPEIRRWGTQPAFSFPPRDHVTLTKQLGLVDFEAGVKVTGSAFVVYRGKGARLERALINFLLDLHTTQHGYIEILPPFLVNADSLTGTTQLPKFGDQLYHCTEDALYLVPTAEVPVTNLHRDEIMEPEALPVRYAAYTPCFRREAGAAGVGTRGLIRMHQFDKVELVKICLPQHSMTELEKLTADAEKVLQLLGLHYRTIELCTGDLGFGSAKTYDIEVWAPGQGGYLEVSSCSNFTDYQARRMKLRYKDPETKKNLFCHTLNGSGTALARLYVALLETYQREDGSVGIPEILQPYFGAEEIRA